MRSDVHTAALRAAAKVAFSVAFLGGCSAASDAEGTDPKAPGADGVEPGTTESDLAAAKKKPKIAAPTTSCHQNDSGAPKPSCESVVAAAFPTEGNYPGTKQAVSNDVQTCCAELLTKSGGSLAKHRWDCCANVAPGQNVAMACTPWGPPVPPSMNRRAKYPVGHHEARQVSLPDAWILDEVA